MSRALLVLPRPLRVYCLDGGEPRGSVAFGVCNRAGVSGALEIVLELPEGYTVRLGPVDLGALGEGGCTTVVGELPRELLGKLCDRALFECYNYRQARVWNIPCFNLDSIRPLFAGKECYFLCENAMGGQVVYVFTGFCRAGASCVFEAHICGYYGQCGLAFTRVYEPEADSTVYVYVAKGASPYTALVVCWSGFDWLVHSPPYVGFPYMRGRARLGLAWATVKVDGEQIARYALPLEVRGLRFGREARLLGSGRVSRAFVR